METALERIKIEVFREQLRHGQEVDLTVQGSSMWPWLKNGDGVVVRPLPFSDIARGDVVLTCAQGRILCHRVLWKSLSQIQTKPDAFIGVDAPVATGDILGKVVSRKALGRVYPLEGKAQRVLNVSILYATFIFSLTYPFLRWLKYRITAFRS